MGGRAFLSLALVVLGVAAPAHAQQAGVPLTVTKQIGEVSVAQGGSVSETVTLANSSSQSLSVLAAVGDVVPSGNGFALRTPGSTADSAAAWVTITPSNVDLDPGETANVTVSVRAPAGVPVGEHAAGVLFSAGRQAQALHTVLVTVIGAGLRRDVTVESVTMPKFEVRGSVPFRITVTNAGNTYAVLHGTLSIRDRLRRTDSNIEIPQFYAMPGRATTFLVEWNDPPPILFARVRANLSVRYESTTGRGDAQAVATTGIAVVWWALGLFIALVLLVLRLLIGLGARRRRRARRERAARVTAAPKPTTGAELPPPVGAAAAAPQRTARSVWDGEPAHTGAAGVIALRRAHTAIRMLREGAGKSGVRPDVAIGLLRSVQDLPEVRQAVEGAYDEAVARRSVREAAALALGLAVVESPHAPEALLKAYAKADRVLAARIKRALAQVDPADIRALPELIDALPHSRRDVLPVG